MMRLILLFFSLFALAEGTTHGRLITTPTQNGVELSWFGEGSLERADSVAGPYSAVTTESPYVASHESRFFYRVFYPNGFPTRAVGQPNILFIILDDWGIDSFDVYNSHPEASLPPLPTLARLADEGMVFTRAYSMPVCSPTRATIMTGRYPFRHGVGAPVSGDAVLQESELTLPEAFIAGESPYSLGSFGKWHLSSGRTQLIASDPNEIGGWPTYKGGLGGGPESYFLWTKVSDGEIEEGVTDYATTVTISDAATWIDAQGSNPWFCWVALNASHTPFHRPPEELHSYTGLDDEPAGAQRRPAYEAALEAADTELARLLESVDLSQTNIIVIGDNGTPNAVVQAPFSQGHAKGSLYEGGVRVPFFITGPDVPTPGVSDALVNCVDLFSTILEMANLQANSLVPGGTEIDSQSLFSHLQGEPFDRAYGFAQLFGSENDANGKAARDEQYKLIRFEESGDEFYDLLADEDEQNNLLLGELSEETQQRFDALSAFLDAQQ